MKKFTKNPEAIVKPADVKLTELDKKASAVYNERVSRGTRVQLKMLTLNDLKEAEKPVTLPNGQEVRFIPVSESPRLSLAGLAKPSYNDAECRKMVDDVWSNHCVNIRSNGYADTVEWANAYNTECSKHLNADNECWIVCRYVGVIPEGTLKKSDGTAVASAITYRVWEWEN